MVDLDNNLEDEADIKFANSNLEQQRLNMIQAAENNRILTKAQVDHENQLIREQTLDVVNEKECIRKYNVAETDRKIAILETLSLYEKLGDSTAIAQYENTRAIASSNNMIILPADGKANLNLFAAGITHAHVRHQVVTEDI